MTSPNGSRVASFSEKEIEQQISCEEVNKQNPEQGLTNGEELEHELYNPRVIPPLEDLGPPLSSSASTTTVEVDADGVSHMAPASRVSTDVYGNTYPEGGSEAYLVVFGSFMGLFGALGMLNTTGTFQAWMSTHQLKDYGEGSVGWIFGVYCFLTFFCGIQIGPLFDAKGPKLLVLAGSILIVVSLVLLGFCSQYWHFMIVLGLMAGVGTSLLFTPTISSIGHFFLARRGRATGLASTGGSVGGVVFPLMLQSLFPKIGFAWATRVVALICLVTLGVACILVKSRLPPKKATKENILPDFRIFRDMKFTFTTLGVFFIEWGLFIPLTYVSSYALAHNMSENFSYQVLAYMNVGSVLGRAIPGFVADSIGRFNTMILTVFLCLASTACLWLPAGDSVALLIVYAVTFGFASGSNISLTPVCVGQLCKTENYGRYYATCYTIVSFGTLTGIPIAGQILSRNGGEYWGLITFTSCCYFAGLICFITARVLQVGWKPFILY